MPLSSQSYCGNLVKSNPKEKKVSSYFNTPSHDRWEYSALANPLLIDLGIDALDTLEGI